MIDKKYSNSRHFGQPPDSIHYFRLLSALLEDISFDVVKLNATRYKGIDRVDYKQASFPMSFNLLQSLLDKIVSLTEIRGLFVNKVLMMLFKLGFVHRIVC